MMSLYRPNKGQRGNTRWLAVATLLIVALLLIDLVSGGAIRSAVRTVSAYAATGCSRVISSILESGVFSTKTRLAAENQKLREDLRMKEAYASQYGILLAQNKELSGLTHLAETNAGATVPVVSTARQSAYGTFMIGAGRNAEISLHDLIVTQDGYAIGRVTDVSARTALVAEFFISGSSIESVINGNSVTLSGQGGGNAIAQVAKGISLHAGDIATSPEADGRPVAVVGHVTSDPASAYSTLQLSSTSNIESLHYVYVMH